MWRWPFVCCLAIGCAAPQKPNVQLTSPARLCDDPSLGEDDFCMPSARIEDLLRTGTLDVLASRRAGGGTTDVKLVYVRFPKQQLNIRVKWKAAPRGGEKLNNSPRKELAAYAVQQLFLGPADYVVPPTVGRCLPLELHKQHFGKGRPTFDRTDCVFGVLTYWVENLTQERVHDAERFESDPAYRRTTANMNVLTYLIDHRDSRSANFALSKDPDRPHAFAVDNGLAFSGMRNPIVLFIPTNWSHIIVPGLPRDQVARLHELTRADLDRLAVVGQYQVRNGQLEEVAAGQPFDQDQGVRRQGDMIQLGLTRWEIDGIEHRLKELMERVDKGEIRVF